MGLKDEENIQSIDYFRRAPSTGAQFVFTNPDPQFVFTNPGLQFYYQPRAFACICRPCVVNLYLYLRPWPIITITDPGPEFAITVLLAVVGSGSSNSSCSNFFGIDNTKFSIPILVD